MTGLDRLRAFARRMDELSVWPGGAKLFDIAEQIEREQGERLMPEGCEWPRYESGDLVMFGDCVENRNGTCTVNSVRFYSGGGVTVYGEGMGAQFVVVTEPVMREPIKRAKHQVLAADGEPLEVGQTVRDVESWEELKVEELCDVGLVQLLTRDGVSRYVYPDQLTHQRPVLDADGVPIKVGDTVYNVNDGTEYEVGGIRDTADVDGDLCKIIECSNDELHIYYACFPPGKLTHAKPEIDSWERWRSDLESSALGYAQDAYHGLETSIDFDGFVRRAKALAEKENRNE